MLWLRAGPGSRRGLLCVSAAPWELRRLGCVHFWLWVLSSFRVSIKESSVAKLGSVCRRIYRIFSHAYFHHRQIFDEYEVSICRRCALHDSSGLSRERVSSGLTLGLLSVPHCEDGAGAGAEATEQHCLLIGLRACFLCLLLFLLVWDRVSRCCSGWPGTQRSARPACLLGVEKRVTTFFEIL